MLDLAAVDWDLHVGSIIRHSQHGIPAICVIEKLTKSATCDPMATGVAITFATERVFENSHVLHASQTGRSEKPIHYIFEKYDAVRARHARRDFFKIGTERVP